MSVVFKAAVSGEDSGWATGVERSVRFRRSASASFTRTQGGSATDKKKGIMSFVVKRGDLGVDNIIYDTGGTTDVTRTIIYFNTSNQLVVFGNATNWRTTTRVFRDPTEWLLVTIVVDTTQNTANNRIRVFVDDIEETSFATTNNPTQNSDFGWSYAGTIYIGRYAGGAAYSDMYLTEYQFIDGQSFYSDASGSAGSIGISTLVQRNTNNIPVPKIFSGTWGNNGFYLNFRDVSSTTTVGYDASGRANLLTYSQDFSNAAWAVMALTPTTGQTAPDGTATATLFTSSSTYAVVYRATTTITANSVNTVSAYFKQGTTASVFIQIGDTTLTNAAMYCYFDVNAGNASSITYVGTASSGTATITAVGGGWYRCALSGIVGSYTTLRTDFGVTISGKTFYIWGTQVNTGATRPEYLPTVASNAPHGNAWTANNISLTSGPTYDSMLDYPVNAASGTQPVGNYATLNPLNNYATGVTISNGNLVYTGDNTGGNCGATIAFDIANSKLEWQVTVTNNSYVGIGIAPASEVFSVAGAAPTANIRWYYGNNGQSFIGSANTTYGVTFTTSDVIKVRIDNGTVTFFKNGVSQGVAWSGLTGMWVPAFHHSATCTFAVDFGQAVFTPTTGYKALCTANLPSDAVTTSGSFTGNASADGPVVYLKGNPTALTINGNAVTFGTHADKLATGFKLRTNSASYNASGPNTFTATAGDKFANNNRSQGNP